MNVLRLTPFFYHDHPTGWDARYDPIGGMQVQIRQASRWLAGEGVRQLILTLGLPGLPRELRPHGNLHICLSPTPHLKIRSEITGLVGLSLSWFNASLVNGLQLERRWGFRPDIIHAHADGMIHPLVLGRLLSRYYNVPFILTLHCSRIAVHKPMSCVDRALHGITRKAEEAAIRSAARVIALTRSTAQTIALDLCLEEGRFAIVPDAVDEDRFGLAQPHDVVRAFGARFGIAADVPIIAFVGRVAREKGWSALVQLLVRLRNRRACVLVVGDGPQRSELERAARQEGIAHRLRITGFLAHSEIPLAYARAAVIVVPSVHEEFGGVAIEAMLSGKPVVGYAVGGLRDTVGRLRPENLVPPGDISGLADRIDAILARPEPESEPSNIAAANWIRQTFGIAAVLPRWMAIYHEVVPQAGLRACRQFRAGFAHPH